MTVIHNLVQCKLLVYLIKSLITDLDRYHIREKNSNKANDGLYNQSWSLDIVGHYSPRSILSYVKWKMSFKCRYLYQIWDLSNSLITFYSKNKFKKVSRWNLKPLNHLELFTDEFILEKFFFCKTANLSIY